MPSVQAGDEVASLSAQEMLLMYERPNHSLFSAYLGYLGVLGDRLFVGSCSANSQCLQVTKEKPVAEDAEVAEVRRER